MKKFYFFLFTFYLAIVAFANPVTALDKFSGTDTSVSISHPIRFLRFSAVRINNEVLVEWLIPSENSSHYQLEQSYNGTIWTPIATFAAAGSINVTDKYEFTDRNIQNQTIYYRVMQVYINGRYSYSPIISARPKIANDQIKISAALNNSVLLYFPQEIKAEVTVSLHSLSGKIVSQQKIVRPVGQVLLSLNTNPGGAYVVHISDGQNLNLSQMITSQK